MSLTLATAGLIGAGIAGSTGIIGNLLSGSTNQNIAEKQIASNEKMNAENLQYQKELNNLIMQREDNAHVREAQDMRNAGLSPYASMNGAGAGGTMSAPQNDIAGMQAPYSAMMQNNNAVAQGISTSINQANSSLMQHLMSEAQLEETMRHNKESESENSRKTALAEAEFGWNKTVELFNQDIEKSKLDLANRQFASEKEKRDAEIKLALQQKLESEARTLQTQEATRLATETHEANVKKSYQEYTDMLLKHRADIQNYESEHALQAWREEKAQYESQLKEIESRHAETKAEQEEKQRDIRIWQDRLNFINSLLGTAMKVYSVTR